MKLSKSLRIISYIYMTIAFVLLFTVAMLMNIDSREATRILHSDLLIFVFGAGINYLSSYFKEYEEWLHWFC